MFRKPIYNEDVTNNFMSRIPLKPVSFPAISMSRFPVFFCLKSRLEAASVPSLKPVSFPSI